MSRKDDFIKDLKPYIVILSKQDIKTIKGQAYSGNLSGARKGLQTVIARYKKDFRRNAFRKAHENTRYWISKGKQDGTYRENFAKNLKYIYKVIN